MKIFGLLLIVLVSFTAMAQDKSATLDATPQRTSKKDKPLYHSDSHSKMMTQKDMEHLPTRDPRDIAAFTPGVYQARRGQELNIGGSRAGGTLYIEDGVQLQRK